MYYTYFSIANGKKTRLIFFFLLLTKKHLSSSSFLCADRTYHLGLDYMDINLDIFKVFSHIWLYLSLQFPFEVAKEDTVFAFSDSEIEIQTFKWLV